MCLPFVRCIDSAKSLRTYKKSLANHVTHFCYSDLQVFQFKCPSAVNCCSFLSESEAVGGTEDGSLWIIDIRSPRLVSCGT